jgi:hypothetical protein
MLGEKEFEVEDIAALNTFIETTKDARELKRALAVQLEKRAILTRKSATSCTFPSALSVNTRGGMQTRVLLA